MAGSPTRRVVLLGALLALLAGALWLAGGHSRPASVTTGASGAAPAREHAALASPGCGDTITVNTTLPVDILDCPGVGLFIGANGITLDLGGHRVDGTNAGILGGIEFQGFDNVTVTNGLITDFQIGVSAQGGSVGDTISNLKIVTANTGILVGFADRAVVTGNSVITTTTAASNGIQMANFGTVSNNSVNGPFFFGIRVDNAGKSITLNGNRVAGARSSGIADTGASTIINKNVVTGSGSDGIFVNGFNTTPATITNNTATFNGRFGIAAIQGATDGGGNKASGNVQTIQCSNVTCIPA